MSEVCGRRLWAYRLSARYRAYDSGVPALCGRPAGHLPPCRSEESIRVANEKDREYRARRKYSA